MNGAGEGEAWRKHNPTTREPQIEEGLRSKKEESRRDAERGRGEVMGIKRSNVVIWEGFGGLVLLEKGSTGSRREEKE